MAKAQFLRRLILQTLGEFRLGVHRVHLKFVKSKVKISLSLRSELNYGDFYYLNV